MESEGVTLHKRCGFFHWEKPKLGLKFHKNEVKTGLIGEIPKSSRGVSKKL